MGIPRRPIFGERRYKALAPSRTESIPEHQQRVHGRYEESLQIAIHPRHPIP